ncbi:hypothetical protein Tco_0583449, partial [Tanacetum coccineum]
GRLRKINPKEAWNTIEELAQYEEDEWDDPIFLNKGSFDYGNATLKPPDEANLASTCRNSPRLIGIQFTLVESRGHYHWLSLVGGDGEFAAEITVARMIRDPRVRVRDKGVVYGGMFVTRLARYFKILTRPMMGALSVEPPAQEQADMEEEAAEDDDGGRETYYPPFGYTRPMLPGYDYRYGTAPDGSS